MKRKNEPTLEVNMTLTELRAVVKSLGIGADHLSKKLQRLSTSSKASEIYEEFASLMTAKQEMEDVLLAVLEGE